MQKKDLIQLGITGILVIVLTLVLGNASKKAGQRKARNVLSKTSDLAGPSFNQTNKLESRGLYEILEQQAKSIELKRDPFTAAPIVNEKALSVGVDLTGILWDENKPLAIIDGNIVKKGARIGDKTIIDIKRDRVLLSDGQVFSEIRLER